MCIRDRDLKRELAEIGEVGRDPQGTIKLEDFIRLFKLITVNAKKRVSKVKRSFSI